MARRNLRLADRTHRDLRCIPATQQRLSLLQKCAHRDPNSNSAMSWVTFIWAMLIGACAAMAFPQFLIWISQRRIVHLSFVILAADVIATLLGELALMHASSVEQFARVLQWRYLGQFAEAARR